MVLCRCAFKFPSSLHFVGGRLQTQGNWEHNDMTFRVLCNMCPWRRVIEGGGAFVFSGILTFLIMPALCEWWKYTLQVRAQV